MFKKFIVCLTDEKRKHLTEIITKGKAAAYKIKHANILLKADADGPNWNDETVADAFSVHRNTVAGIRQRFVEQGLEGVDWQFKTEEACIRLKRLYPQLQT